MVVPWYRNRGGGTEGGCPSKIFVERPLPPKTEPRNLRLAQQWAGLFLLPKNNGLPAQRCFQHPALPAVISNKQPTRPPQPRPATSAHPSSLRPTYTAYPHLRAICPAARIHHQTIIYYSQLAQNRILHFNTRPEYLPTSPSHADPPVAPYDSCPVHISQLQPRPITHPGFIRRRQAQAFRAAGWCIPAKAKGCPQFTPKESQAAATHTAKAAVQRPAKKS